MGCTSFSYSQNIEMVLNDFKECTNFEYISKDIKKQLKKTQDTFLFYHDMELIVFFNQKKTKSLFPNTLYIFNHGYNKLLTFRIMMMEIEVSNGKKDKKRIISSPTSSLDFFKQDSFQRCSRTYIADMKVNHPSYKKAEITAVFVEMEYYEKKIFKWFLHEPEKIPDELVMLNWSMNNK